MSDYKPNPLKPPPKPPEKNQWDWLAEGIAAVKDNRQKLRQQGGNSGE